MYLQYSFLQNVIPSPKPLFSTDVSEPLITSKITTFYRYISDIFVQGGGDCPEMTVSGIEKALLSSDPHSSIFVFTDGSAKDFEKTDQVLNLIQKTQSQVSENECL